MIHVDNRLNGFKARSIEPHLLMLLVTPPRCERGFELPFGGCYVSAPDVHRPHGTFKCQQIRQGDAPVALPALGPEAGERVVYQSFLHPFDLFQAAQGHLNCSAGGIGLQEVWPGSYGC